MDAKVGRAAPIAGLPMYDWPEVLLETDRFWACLRNSFSSRGIATPALLDREIDLHGLWKKESLAIAQTCGFPFATLLAGHTRLIGAPAYDLDCLPGYYYSCLIVPARRPCSLAGFAGRVAVNGFNSQSGYVALLTALAAENGGAIPDLDMIVSGSHRESLRLVATGAADLAAIDAVSLLLARRHTHEAADVQVIGRSAPTPGLPLITAFQGPDLALFREAVAEAIDALDDPARHALGLKGFVALDAADYDTIAATWAGLQPALGQAKLTIRG